MRPRAAKQHLRFCTGVKSTSHLKPQYGCEDGFVGSLPRYAPVGSGLLLDRIFRTQFLIFAYDVRVFLRAGDNGGFGLADWTGLAFRLNGR